MNSQSAARTPMVIHIAIETLDPLSGTVSAERGEELSFEGWLGLLEALSKMVGSAAQQTPTPQRRPHDV